MTTLDKTTISTTIYLSFGLVIGLTLLLAFTSIISLKENHSTLNHIVTSNNVKTELIHSMQLAGRNRMLTLDYISLEKDAFKQDEYIQQFSQDALDFIIAREKLLALKLSDTEKKLLQQQSINSVKAVKIQEQVLELALAEKRNDALQLLLDEAIPAQSQTIQTLDKLLKNIVKHNHLTESLANSKSDSSLQLIYISLAIVIILSLLIAFFIQRHLSHLFGQIEETSTDLNDTLIELNYQQHAVNEHSIVSITDNRGVIIYVNEKFEKISGYSKKELMGKNHNILNSNFHDKDFFLDMWKVISQGLVWHGDIKNRTKRDKFYWVATTIVPFLDKDGKPERYVSIRTDITKVKQAETNLLNLNKKLEIRVDERTAKLEKINLEIEHDKKVIEVVTKSTLNVKGDAFFKTLVNCIAAALNVRCALISKITDINSGNAHTVAVWANNYFENNIEILMPDTPSYNLLTGSFAYFPEKVKELFPEIPFIAKQNIESYFAVPFMNSNEEVIGYIAIMDDKALVGIHKIRQTLDLFGMRAGAEMERQSNEKELADAYQHKSEFLASMSHELRTPLNAIIGFSHQLMNGDNGPVNEKQKENLSLIERGGKHLLMLISEILDTSKLEAGKMNLKIQEIELQIFFDDIIANISSLADEKKLQLTTEINTALITQAYFDRLRTKQILLNLLSNAIKFTEQGQVSIICDMVDNQINLLPEHRQEAIKNSEVPYLLMAIVDSGIGIENNQLNSIFNQFHQIDGGLHPSDVGTGLGLSISKQLVELHNGEIWAKSTVNKGSTFAFILPLFGHEE